MGSILEEIIQNTSEHVAQCKKAVSEEKIADLCKLVAPALNFGDALRGHTPRIISECKRRSPSKGVLCDPYSPIQLARSYENGGAAAISCLTEQKYFGGHLDDLVAIKKEVSLPVLRKDFIIDPYQIYEARAHGADSFLLLSGVLDSAQLREYLELGRSLGMEPLIESHTEEQLRSALESGGNIFGINNRNLKTFDVSLEHSLEMAQIIKTHNGNAIMVCESGINSRADIEQMWEAGYTSFLVGEALVKAENPSKTIQNWARKI